MKKLQQISLVVAALAVTFPSIGCHTEEDQVREDALKSRNEQAKQMASPHAGQTGAPAGGTTSGYTPPPMNGPGPQSHP